MSNNKHRPVHTKWIRFTEDPLENLAVFIIPKPDPDFGGYLCRCSGAV